MPSDFLNIGNSIITILKYGAMLVSSMLFHYSTATSQNNFSVHESTDFGISIEYPTDWEATVSDDTSGLKTDIVEFEPNGRHTGHIMV